MQPCLQASNFTDFYRGLLFVAESTNPAEGTLLSLDLSQAAFEITYEYQQKDIDGNYVTDDSGDPVLEENTINMTMTGRKVNFFNNNFNWFHIPVMV